MSLGTVQFLLDHPLSRHQKLAALKRFMLWQLGSRILNKPVVTEFVNGSRLLVRRGMTGATGNLYVGLHEFEHMAFVLHGLRATDLFVDVGANIGSYTVLAGAGVGAEGIAIEPIPSTFAALQDNINLNGLTQRIERLNVGIGKTTSTLYFSTEHDTKNHVITQPSTRPSESVSIRRLDDILQSRIPRLIKIDVEGWETEVIAGADQVLRSPSPLAVIMEFGEGRHYGFDEDSLHQRMLDYGFETVTYRPLERAIESLQGGRCQSGNVIYLKDVAYFQERVTHAPTYHVAGVSF